MSWLLRSLFVCVALLCVGVSAVHGEPQGSGQRPKTVILGNRLARIVLPRGTSYLGAGESRRLMSGTGEPVDGNELGMVVSSGSRKDWSILLRFDPLGYVREEGSERLDAAALLAGIRAQTAEAARRGSPVRVLGWAEPPHYRRTDHRLTWVVRAEAKGHRLLTASTRLLGRTGVATIDLVVEEGQYTRVRPLLEDLVAHFTFFPGYGYETYVSGKDLRAEVDLAGLIAEGRTAVIEADPYSRLQLFVQAVLEKAWFVLVGIPVPFIILWLFDLLEKQAAEQKRQQKRERGTRRRRAE